MEAKFDFYEIVRIRPSIHSLKCLKKIEGLEGTIIGRVQDEETGEWYYTIDVRQRGGYSVDEHELEKTGKFANRDDYKSVGSIRVQVLPDGSGRIVEENGIPSSEQLHFNKEALNIKKKTKSNLIKYSSAQFGKELKERVSKRQDIEEIAKWVYSIYLEDTGGGDREFYALLSDLGSMDLGPNLALSYEKLDEISDDLIAGREVDSDELFPKD